MVSFEDLNLAFTEKNSKIKIGDVTITVRHYLPIKEKTELIQFVVNSALDDKTGCFSPLRLELYYAIATCKWYTDIEFTDDMLMNISNIYDLLDSNGVISAIMSAIPSEEREFMSDLVNDTVDDIARYNNSAVGIIQNMSSNAEGLNGQIQDIMNKIQNKEGTEELLSYIKDIYG